MAKTKTIPKRYSVRLEKRQTSFDPEEPGPWSSLSSLTATADDVITHGDSVPDWKNKIRKAQSATSSLAVNATSLNANPKYGGKLVVERRRNSDNRLMEMTETRGHLGAGTFTFPGGASISQTSADNQALMQFVSECLKAQRAFQGGVFLGELKETLQFLRRPGMGVRKLLRNYLSELRKRSAKSRRMSRSSRLRVTKDSAASTWLETQFALKPLLSDIDGISDALWTLAQRQETMPVRGRGQGRVYHTKIDASINVGFASLYRCADDVSEINVKYYGAVKCETGATGTRQHLGALPRDFVPTIYELIPYSWLVDYFTNLGEIVSAVCFNRSDIAWMNRGTRLRRFRILTQATPTLLTPPPGYYHTLKEFVPPGKFLAERTQLSRTRYTGSLIPSLEFSLPNPRQWLNVTALVSQGRDVERYVRR